MTIQGIAFEKSELKRGFVNRVAQSDRQILQVRIAG